MAAVIGVIVLVAVVFFGVGEDTYEVKAKFQNAGQLVNGNPVQSGGAPIGSVTDIEITDDSQAKITLKIDEKHAPLPKGTRATIRQFSQSGIANRYVDLTFPSQNRTVTQQNTSGTIEDGGTLSIDETKTAVDLDELFNTLDKPTRDALKEFFRGQQRQFANAGEQANATFRYLNPAFSTSSRLFNELSKDTPVLERFIVDSSRLVGALAERRDDLAALIGNANDTTRALGNQQEDLAASIELLPPVMRRANTTFVNLRAALTDVDPLVEASKPVAKKLGPFLNEARAFAAGARPTVRDLSLTIRRRGRANDLNDLLKSVPPLTDIALADKQRTAAPGGRADSVGRTRGAFPETTAAFQAAAPEIGFARPYTSDFLGWFDDFSTTGAGFDALGATARGQISFSETLGGEASTTSGQFKRCPGSSEAPAPDGSNVLSQAEQQALNCSESARSVK